MRPLLLQSCLRRLGFLRVVCSCKKIKCPTRRRKGRGLGFSFNCVVFCVSFLIGAVTHAASSDGGESSYLILTDLDRRDPYYVAVNKLREHRSAQTVHFTPGKLSEALPQLESLKPRFVAIVVKPDVLDVNLIYEILEIGSGLDDDPFTDFAYGFITGANADDAVALVSNTIKAEKEWDKFPNRIFEFGPSNVPQIDDEASFDTSTSWKRTRVAHPPGSFPKSRLAELSRSGVVRFWGHGHPKGVDGGLSYKDIQGLDLFPAVVFAGPCYSAVTVTSYETCQRCGRVRGESVEPTESLALAFVARGACGYFGALDKDRCVSAAQEMEFALSTGDSLGMVSKCTYDAVVMARRSRHLCFSRMKKGMFMESEDYRERQSRMAASRVLIGDPAFQPFVGEGVVPVDARTKRTRRGLEVDVTVTDPSIRCAFVDLFHRGLCSCKNMNDLLYKKIVLPPDFGKTGKVTLTAMSESLYEIDRSKVNWIEEEWFGKRLLHVQVEFKHDSLTQQGQRIRFLVGSQL